AFPELLRAAGYYTYATGKSDYQFSDMLGGGPFSIWDKQNARPLDWQGRPGRQPFYAWINLECDHESDTFVGHWPHSLNDLFTQGLRLYQGCSSRGPIKPGDIQVPPYYPDTPTVRTDMAHHYNAVHQVDGQVGEIVKALRDDGLLDNTIILVLPDHGDGLPRAKRDLYDAGIHLPLIVWWPEKYRPAGVTPGMIDGRMISYVD